MQKSLTKMITWHFGQVKVETANAYSPSHNMTGILTELWQKGDPRHRQPTSRTSEVLSRLGFGSVVPQNEENMS